MTKVIVDTSDYERSHGRRPRGRGGWLFCTVDPRQNDYLNHLLPCIGGATYEEARRAAIAEARTRGLAIIYTCA